jgi:hypothetical protein
MKIKIIFTDSYYMTVSEKYCFVTLDNNISLLSLEQGYSMADQVKAKMKEMFTSIKFNQFLFNSFDFTDPADEAYYILWANDAVMEIDV